MKEAFIDHIVQLTPYISIAAVAFIISLALAPAGDPDRTEDRRHGYPEG